MQRLFICSCFFALSPILKRKKKKKENTHYWVQDLGHNGCKAIKHVPCSHALISLREGVSAPQADSLTWGQGIDRAETKYLLLSCTRRYGSATRPSECPPPAFWPCPPWCHPEQLLIPPLQEKLNDSLWGTSTLQENAEPHRKALLLPARHRVIFYLSVARQS